MSWFACDAQAQISYVTVRTIKWQPIVPLVILPPSATNAAAATQIPIAPPVSPTRPPVKPSLDKAELEEHVVAFQKQRAEQGSVSAQYELGLRYLSGNGVEQNVQLARKWLQMAADGGDSRAARKVAELKKPSP
jgi:hypothetical protein